MAWDGLDLRPFGWAPGGYIFQCIDCPPDQHRLSLDSCGAKRSWRCKRHALKRKAELLEFPPAPRIEWPVPKLESAPAAGAENNPVDGQS
jgi:hypothetical protein